MTSLPRLLLIPGVQYDLEDYRAPPSSWKLSFLLRLNTTQSLAPRAGHLHSQPPDPAPSQQQQNGRTQVHGCRQSLDHTKTASKTGNHETDMPALAGSRREETRALQKEAKAGQEVSGCSAGEMGGSSPFHRAAARQGLDSQILRRHLGGKV